MYRRGRSTASKPSDDPSNSKPAKKTNTGNGAPSTPTKMNPSHVPDDPMMEYLRNNSNPLGNNIRIAGSPRSGLNGPRQAVIIVHILRFVGGIHAIIYWFRRLEDLTKGTYVEKIHRDQVRGRDEKLLGPPLNILKTTFGAYENGQPLLNEKGYEQSVFVSLHNFENKNRQEVTEFAKVFATAIKNHIERDPNCQNQEVVVTEGNIHDNMDRVMMDYIGERNAVNLYRSILPVDSTPGYSQFFVNHARSFFRPGTLSPQSVAFIKADDTFLAPEHVNNGAQDGGEEPQPGQNQNNEADGN